MKLLPEPEIKNEQHIVAGNNPNYNWIYGRLVQDENDLVGAIAYVLYKQHKIEFINQIENQSGADPSPEQWAEFHRSTCLESNILNYQNRAGNLVNQFLQNILSDHFQKLESQADQRAAEKAELMTLALREKIIELENTINLNHGVLKTEIENKKTWVVRLGEAFLNIVYSVLIIAIIGGLVGGYKWINSLNSSTEKAVGIKN